LKTVIDKVSRLSQLRLFSVKFLIEGFLVSHVESFTEKGLNRDNRDKAME
jgi:hypothetical protein